MSGSPWIDSFHFSPPTNLAVVANAITVTQEQHTVLMAGAIKTLLTLTKAVIFEGDVVTLRPDTAFALSIRGTGGNIRTPLGVEIVLAAITDYATFQWNGTNWILIDTSVAALVASTFILAAGSIGAAGELRERHLVDTEGAAALDQLDTIVGGVLGQKLRLSSVSIARDVEITSAGNIRTPYRLNVVLGTPVDYVDLEFDGTNWNVVGVQVLEDVSSELTIAAGVITINRPTHTVRGEGAVADILSTINGGQIGSKITLRAGTERITLQVGGNIRISGGVTISIFDAADFVVLEFTAQAGGAWNVVGWSSSLASEAFTVASQKTASAAVVNPAVQTFFDRPQTIPADNLVLGSRVRIKGSVSKTVQDGADMSTYELQIGNVPIITHTQTAAATAMFIFEADLIIRVGGAAAVVEGWARVVQAPLAGGAVAAQSVRLLDTIVINATLDRDVRIGVTRGADVANNSSRQNMLSVEIG